MQKLRLLTMLAMSGLVVGCASRADRAADKEDLLAAAGFSFVPATSPARVQRMNSLTPNHFYRKIEGDKVVYLYSDPLICACLYIGDQAAYGRYRQEVLQRQIAREEQFAAETYGDTWDWGVWGPGWWAY
jgi:hypothetical protein